MKVRVIKEFKDKANRLESRAIGEVFEVSDKRYEELIKIPLGAFVEVISNEKLEVSKKSTKNTSDEKSETKKAKKDTNKDLR